MYRSFLTTLLAVFILPLQMNAQEEEKGGDFSIDINLRPRFEYRNGYNYPRLESDKASAFISNRARIGANFDNGFLSARVAAQEISIWGSKKQNDNDGSHFTMHEAWVQMQQKGYFAKIGRQSLSYDDGRILSESSWTPTGIWHDALKVGYANQMHTLHLIFAYNQSREKTNEGAYYEPVGQPYQNMQAMWYQYNNSGRRLKASLLFINLGFEVGEAATGDNPADSKRAYMQTMGTNIGYTGTNWNLTGSVYYQTGRNNNDKKVNAYMLALRGRYAHNPRFSLYGGTEFHPGQDADSEKITRMDLLYRSNHSFMGSMDYFKGYDYYGVWDKYLGVNWNAWKKLRLDLRYHHFSSAKDIDVESDLIRKLGSEIDFTFNYPIRKYIMLEGGYSFMLATDAMPIAKGRAGTPDAWQDWAYLSITINPTIFKGRF